MKKIAIFMMQKNEKDLLPIFVAYYGALFGYENIYIFDNGSDAYMLDELRKSEVLGCNVSLEFSSHADFERKGEIVASYINNLTDKYDVFLPLDCDEFIGIEVPDGYSCESEDLLQGFEEINGSHGYQISQRFYNHPFKKNLFTKNLKGMRKLFFGKSKVESLDVGFHDCASPKNIVLSPFVYFEFHHKPFETLIEHAKTKLKSRLDLSADNLGNYSGKGNHLIKFLKMTKKQYEDYINELLYIKSSTLEECFIAYNINYPFFE